jgi:hypothetical protein
MPSLTVPGYILDARGNVATYLNGSSSAGGNQLYARTADDDRLRPRPGNHFADYIAMLSPWHFRELVSECRALAQRGLVPSVLESKADYVAASGFRPRFTGQDETYGRAALAELERALAICNLRGPEFNWRTTWRLSVPTRATDGALYVLLTTWGDSGWPALQCLEGHRIGQRAGNYSGIVGADDAWTTITDAEGKNPQRVRGAYKGLAIQNGHIFNRTGTTVAFRVLGPTPEDDEDISARDMICVCRPRRFSEGRPAPELAAPLLDFLAVDLAQTCQLDQQIQDARLSFIETTASGRPDLAAQAMGGGIRTPAGTPTTIEERGMTRTIKSGHTLTPLNTGRPSDQWMNFDERVSKRACTALRWRLEMLDPSALRGTATRAFQDQINTTIQDEFHIDAPAAARAVRYFVAKLTALGVIPKHPEWDRWSIAPPPWFEVDRASAKIDIEDVAAGRTSMSTLHSRDGHTTGEVYTERIQAYEMALAYQKKHPQVPLEIILGDLGVTASRSGFYPQVDPMTDPDTEAASKSTATSGKSAKQAEPQKQAEAAPAPVINITLPEIKIAPPQINVAAPDINITNTPPAVTFNNTQPTIHVDARLEKDAIRVEHHSGGAKRIQRDEQGRMIALVDAPPVEV